MEEYVVDNIGIQCNTKEDEALLIKYLNSLGVTTCSGQELHSLNTVLVEKKEYIVSYWNGFAEDGVYTIGKIRLGRYYLQYCTNHSGEVINISDYIEEDKPVTDNKSEFDFGALSFFLGFILLIFVMIKFC